MTEISKLWEECLDTKIDRFPEEAYDRIPNPGAVEIDFLDHWANFSYGQERITAIRALGVLFEDEDDTGSPFDYVAAELVKSHVFDRNPKVRYYAVQALWQLRFGDVVVSAMLEEEENPEVIQIAKKTLDVLSRRSKETAEVSFEEACQRILAMMDVSKAGADRLAEDGHIGHDPSCCHRTEEFAYDRVLQLLNQVKQ